MAKKADTGRVKYIVKKSWSWVKKVEDHSIVYFRKIVKKKIIKKKKWLIGKNGYRLTYFL